MVITGGYLRHPKTGPVEIGELPTRHMGTHGETHGEMPTRPFEFDKSQSLVTELAGLGGQVSNIEKC